MNRCNAHPNGGSFICQHFLDNVIKFFFDEEISLYQPASNILSELVRTHVTTVLSDANLELLKNKLEAGSSIIQSRILSFYASTSFISEEVFNYYLNHGLLKLATSGIDSYDLLLKIDTFERINNVSRSIGGVKFIVSEGIYDIIIELLKDKEDPFSNLLLPKAIDLLADISTRGALYYDILKSKNTFLDLVHAHFEHENDEVIISCMNCYASVCSTTQGLKDILEHPTILRDWSEFLSSSNIEVKKITMSLFAKVIEADRDEDISDLLKSFYTRLYEPDTTEFIVRQFSAYSQDVRYSAFAILSALSKYKWGAEIICNYPKLTDYLIDRSTESALTGSEWKFSIVQRLWSLDDSKKVLGVNNFYMFVEYLKQGVVFQKQQSTTLIKDEAM